MTNYNERLDEILALLNAQMPQPKTINEAKARVAMCHKAKQAITSLYKELVEEAKPDDFLPEGHEADACINHDKYTSACCGCQKQRARNHAIDEFEQNLLKALEERE